MTPDAAKDVAAHIVAAQEHIERVERAMGKKCTPRLRALLTEAFLCGVVRGGEYVVEVWTAARVAKGVGPE